MKLPRQLVIVASDEEIARAHTLALVAIDWAAKLPADTAFEDASASLRELVAKYQPLPDHAAQIYEELIRGVDAPRPVLTAGVEGKWTAKVDESGIFVSEDADRYNDPALCTHKQTGARAYQLAAQVWENVKACRSFSEVGNVLRSAGCSLHYWCRVD